MPPPNLPVLRAASPRCGAVFDPWNSASTGHQRPESTPGTGWRNSRNKKLNSQFSSGDGSGGERLSDTWGAGSEDYDAEKKALIPKIFRERRGRSVADMLKKPGLMRQTIDHEPGLKKDASPVRDDGFTTEERLMETRRLEDEEKAIAAVPRGIFDGLVIYVNGSTFPLVSDHKLKQIVSENGGFVSLHLGRRKVTHVILGRGLAAGKIEREIQKIGGVGIKYVSVEWVLESLKAGRRLPEARFSNIKTALKGQNSVYGLYSNQSAS